MKSHQFNNLPPDPLLIQQLERVSQGYEPFLGQRSTLLLSGDSPLFRYLSGPRPEGDKTVPGASLIPSAKAPVSREW